MGSGWPVPRDACQLSADLGTILPVALQPVLSLGEATWALSSSRAEAQVLMTLPDS